MPQRRPTLGETWRVLAYTLAIALAFIALERMQLAVFSMPGTAKLLQGIGLLDAKPQDALQEQAAQVAAASREALQRLPRGHRMAALRLGFELGYASQAVGGYATAQPEAQAAARRRAQARLQAASEHARLLGLGEVDMLEARNLKQFVELGQRYERDENGLAARIEQTVSPMHRHLYLLGAQLGGEAGRVEDSGGRFALPPATPIRRNAVLAGIDESLWQALIVEPRDETPAMVLARYRQAIDALMSEVARLDAQDTASAR